MDPHCIRAKPSSVYPKSDILRLLHHRVRVARHGPTNNKGVTTGQGPHKAVTVLSRIQGDVRILVNAGMIEICIDIENIVLISDEGPSVFNREVG